MKRAFDPADLEERTELSPLEVELNFKSRRKLDRCLGVSRLMRNFLRAWLTERRSYRILDLVTGTGDASRYIAGWARKQDIRVQIDAVDLYPPLLEIARKQSAEYPEITFIRADSRSFSGGSTYDLVCCLNVLRNFSGEDAVRVIRAAAESSHDKVLVGGFERHLASMPGVCFVTAAMAGDPVKKSEARFSIRNSFSFVELDELAQRAGWGDYGHRRFLPAAQAIWMCKRETEGVVDCPLPSPDFVA